jgi:hypothetical protein
MQIGREKAKHLDPRDLCASLLQFGNAVKPDGIARMPATPSRLRLLPARRLTLPLAADPVPVSYARIRIV